MVPNWVLYLLAVIGALVVLTVLLYAFVLLFGIILILLDLGLDKLSSVFFHLGDGSEDQHPKPPYDRLWVETRWIEQWVKYCIMRFGYSAWNPDGKPIRPDLERLYELREEYGFSD